MQRLVLLQSAGELRLTCVNQSGKLTFAKNRRIAAIAIDGFLELGN